MQGLVRLQKSLLQPALSLTSLSATGGPSQGTVDRFKPSWFGLGALPGVIYLGFSPPPSALLRDRSPGTNDLCLEASLSVSNLHETSTVGGGCPSFGVSSQSRTSFLVFFSVWGRFQRIASIHLIRANQTQG